MVFLSKIKKAARLREAKVRLARQFAEGQTLQEGGSAPNPMILNLEVEVEPQEDPAVEPMLVEEIKQELELTGEVKVEPLELVEEEGPDPIGGQQQFELLEQPEESSEVYSTGTHCQFCLRRFEEADGRDFISRRQAVFVLGLRKEKFTEVYPECCHCCKKQFDQSFKFKKSCLAALARYAELQERVEEKANYEIIDLKLLEVANRAEVNTEEAKNQEECPQEVLASIEGPISDGSSLIGNVGFEVYNDQPPMEKNGYFYCSGCLQWFQTETLFLSHKPQCIAPVSQKEVPLQRTPSNLHCNRCRKSFGSELLFEHHKPLCIEWRVKKRSQFPCELCPQRCNSQESLTLHMYRHKGIRSLPCRREGCTKMFMDTNIRRKHEENCGQDVLASICSICGATFRHRSNLQIHMIIHSEPKFPCEHCDKKFHSKARLKKHSTVHSDERNYECKVCGKRFKSYEANRVHQRIHTLEKPYVCHICGTAFTYNCSLKTHLEKGHATV